MGRANSAGQGWPVTVEPSGAAACYNAALARCDMDDGLKDGVISDPYHCRFDPSELVCKSGVKTACLSEAQVDAVKKIYAGPMTSKGEIRGPAPGTRTLEVGACEHGGMIDVGS